MRERERENDRVRVAMHFVESICRLLRCRRGGGVSVGRGWLDGRVGHPLWP